MRLPMMQIRFSSSRPVCHAYDPEGKDVRQFDVEGKDGHDLVVGLLSGEIYTMSLRRHLVGTAGMLVGARQYNKNGKNTRSQCTCVAWVPDGGGSFVSAHADGSLYVYRKNKDEATNPSFPAIKDPTEITITHARSSKCNPITRWHILKGPISNISFSTDGSYLAVVGSDGCLRVFDYHKEKLFFGGKSTCDALLCSAWSLDGQYIVTGGVDGLVHVWSTRFKKMVAYGKGHYSRVSQISFDSYWSAPNSNITSENVSYRFGSVSQDGLLLIWNLETDKNFIPRDEMSPLLTTLQPCPSIHHLSEISPVGKNSGHVDSLSSLIFSENSLVAISNKGNINIWDRPVMRKSTKPIRSK